METAQIKATTHPITLQPSRKFTKKIPTRFVFFRDAAMIVGKKYKATLTAKKGKPKRWNIIWFLFSSYECTPELVRFTGSLTVAVQNRAREQAGVARDSTT